MAVDAAEFCTHERRRTASRPSTAPITSARSTPREAADGGAEGERPGGYGEERGAQEHEGRRVVQEALTLEHRRDARRDPEALRDARRHGIRGAQDRPERHAQREADAREHEGEEPAEKKRRDDDEDDGEPRDRREVAPELDRRQSHRGGVEERREHPDEDEVGVDLGHLHEGQQPHDEPQRDEQEGAGHAESLPQRRHDRDGDHRDEDDEEQVHGAQIRPSPRTASRSATSSATDASMRARARSSTSRPSTMR
jgi:hypothetical protein